MTPERREARVRRHLYETCEGIAEHAERIVALEELAEDLWRLVGPSDRRRHPGLADRNRVSGGRFF